MFPPNIELAELIHQHSKTILNIRTLVLPCNPWVMQARLSCIWENSSLL
jgi:hypothetical protein